MADTRSGSDKPIFVLKESLRRPFSEPVGKLVRTTDEMAAALSGNELVVSIGDVVTIDLLEMGRIPDISIIDYSTKRIPMPELKARFSKFHQEEVRVRNPAGTITQALWDAVEDAFRNPRRLRIVVDGEEDLASLICIYLAPENTRVIYGIPDRGALVLRVDGHLKNKVKNALDEMRV